MSLTKSINYSFACEVCGCMFQAHRRDATTCSNKCRVKKTRNIKTGQGRAWYAVRPEYRQSWQECLQFVPQSTQDTVADLLRNYGAAATEYAIAAIIDAVNYQHHK